MPDANLEPLPDMPAPEAPQETPEANKIDAPPDTPPKAIATPHNFLASGNFPQAYFKAKFNPILKRPPGSMVYCRNQETQYFITPDANDTIRFPTEHVLAPKERYDWWVVAEDRTMNMLSVPYRVSSFFDRQDAVKFGWPIDEQATLPPSLDDKELDQRNSLALRLAYQTTMARMMDLLQRDKAGTLEMAESQELSELKVLVDRVKNEGPHILIDKPK